MTRAIRTNRLLVIGGAANAELLNMATRRGLELVVLSVPALLENVVPRDPIVALEPIHFQQSLPAIVNDIIEVATRYEVAGIITIMEFSLMPATLAAQKLGLPTQPMKAVRNTRDKVQMRRVLSAAGMGQVDFAGCRTLDEARAFFAKASAPIILKPLSGTGSDGVTLVHDEARLEAAWQLASGSLAFGGIICESYIDGPEVSVEGYVSRGEFVPVAITDKITNEQFLEIGHSQPTRKAADLQAEIYDYVARVLQALGVDECWTHTEVRLSRNGPVIIETHTRPGGASIDLLTRRTTGVSTYDVMFDFALGITPVDRPLVTGEAAVVRFVMSEPGVIASIDVPPVPESIAFVQIDYKAGHTISERSASANRLGHMVGVGADVDEATRNAESFRDRVVVSYEGGQQWITPAA
ncbi:MAG TPA: ATP-grasp domain-containing protein [Thermoanaerobaculia bacterium]|jgi:biotin carboxylase